MTVPLLASDTGLTASELAAAPGRIRARLQTADATDRARLERDLPIWEAAADLVAGQEGRWAIDWSAIQADVREVSLEEAVVAIAEYGARNSKADMKTIQDAHDALHRLGAVCAPDEAAPMVEAVGDPEAIRFGESGMPGYEPVTLAEAGALFDDATQTVTIIPIRPGHGNKRDRFYYPPETLREAVDKGLFNGRKVYKNHPTKEDKQKRPERNVDDWVAVVRETRWDATRDVPVSSVQVVDEGVYKRWKAAPDHVAFSVLGDGSARAGRVDGKDARIVESIGQIRSVDWVTEAGAGGAIFAESEGDDMPVDWSAITADDLRENRPDLIDALREADEPEGQSAATGDDVEDAGEPEQEPAGEPVPEEYVSRAEFDALRRELVTMKVKEAVAEGKERARAIVEAAVRDADLTRAAKDFVVSEFSEVSVGEGLTYDSPAALQKAVGAKVTQVKSLTAGLVRKSGVRGLGASTEVAEPRSQREQVRESVAATFDKMFGTEDISEASSESSKKAQATLAAALS